MTGDTRRIIVAKRKTYDLAPEAESVQLADRYPGATLPDRLKNATIYQTLDGPVVAAPDTGDQAK